jgi:hypothetical protein
LGEAKADVRVMLGGIPLGAKCGAKTIAAFADASLLVSQTSDNSLHSTV